MHTTPTTASATATTSSFDSSLEVRLQARRGPSLDVSLQCGAGEMLALVGPSGSGKSTVLRTIAGLRKVDQGFVRCGNTLWMDTDNKKYVTVQQRQVGMVFQHYALFPHKSVIDNVILAIRNKSRKEKKNIAATWLERTNMTGLESRRPDQLSGGQKQRVALARALASNPAALLLDEPFSAVDQQTRRKLYRELAKLRTGLDIPMILVTHDVGEVQQLADSMCLIYKGQTLQQGSVHDVMTAPESKTIAKLLGHQNLFSATVVHHDKRLTRYQLGDGETLQGSATKLNVGQAVTLLIAPSAITIDSDSSAHDIGSNRLKGSVRDAVSMGDEWSITVHLDAVTKSLRFRIPQHQIDSRHVLPGTPLNVNVRAGGIYAISESMS